MPSRYNGVACILLFVAFLTLPSAHAQSRGAIIGRVTDAIDGAPLPGANVVLEGLAAGTATDADGAYRLSRLFPGSYTLRVSYIGYEAQTFTVDLTAGATVRQDVALEPASVEGEGVVVTGLRAQGQAKALSQQRNAANIINVVASDQIGRFPDPSAPEALQRVPGIGVQRDQGEGRFIQIRGASPQFTSVTFNGERIPSPEGDIRSIALDAVPTEVLESIEVSKAITPDMDADAIGGSVNLVTRRAPFRTIFSVEGGGGYADVRRQGSIRGTATYGTRVAENKVGILVNGTLNRRNFGSDNIEPEYDLGPNAIPLGGDDRLDELQVRYYDLTRQRIGLNGVVDYRFSDQSEVYLRGVFSQLQDTEQRHRLRHQVEDEALVYQHKNRTEYLQTLSLNAGGEHVLGNGWDVDYQATFARSSEDTPEDVEISWEQEGVSFSPDLSDPNQVRANPQDGALTSGAFLFEDIEPASSLTTNTDYVATANLTRQYSLGGATSGALKVGAKYRYKDKEQDVFERAFELGDDGAAIRLGDGNGVPFSRYYSGFPNRFVPGRYNLPPIITGNDEVLTFADRYSDRLVLDPEASTEGDLEDFSATEQTLAGYVMTELNVSPKLLLLPGVRYERTTLESTGFVSVIEDGDLVAVEREEDSNTYGYFFPMLHLRYQLTPQTNVRAAVTTALGRPNFFELAPYQIQDDDEVERGNPSLQPSRSVNLDLLAEHYTESIGVISGGLFYKRITDPVLGFREEGVVRGQPVTIFQSRNGEAGTIWGVELAYQQQLQFLPGALSGLGVYANYTYTSSESTLPSGDTARFPGQVNHIANMAVSYERGGFSGQISLNYTGEFLDEFGGDGFSVDRASDFFVEERWGLDVNATYQLPSGVSVFAEALNLLNEPLVLYQGSPQRPIQREFYRSWFWIGAGYNL
ncbi:MAG: TonB-dependent receptor [Bacteroidetes bacterium]|jgi:TonB-dependent receptor|nr:TonB-dependent receptor [Bacteroidota bacterium]